GVGHYNMRGHMVVEDQASFDAWLAKQQTFAMTMAKTAPPMAAAPGTAATPTPETTVASGTDLVEQGRALAQSKGCVAC
ncbi:cytochrome b, partial [Burkholderia sp. SIMBA_019]